MPEPRAGESQSDWMHRCVPMLINEGRAQDQAVAACMNMYKQGHKVFGYGELVRADLRKQLTNREVPYNLAMLPGYVKHGDNILPMEGGTVAGVTFELTADELKTLDGWEHPYERTVVQLEDGSHAYAYHLTHRKRLEALGIETYDQEGGLVVDESKMCATGIFSTSTIRDRQGDVLETAGIDCSNHMLNPIVLLDHGLVWPLPIGKTCDPDGNYTVQLSEADAKQTTYFSQHSREAEQTFRLICEGILTANSIGWKGLDVKPLAADRESPRGKHILRCELIEISWVGIPANPECVTALLDRGTLGDKALAPAIKSFLLPYKLPSKVWSPGVKMEPMPEPMSAIDESRGGALRKEDEAKPHDEPLGSKLLRGLHGDLSDMVDRYAGQLPDVLHPKAKDHLEKMMGHLRKAMDQTATCHQDHYPEEEPIKGEEREDDMQQRELQQIEEPEDAYREKALDLAKQLVEQIMEGTKQAPATDGLTAEERKQIRRLEKAIARREKMLARKLSN